MTPRRSLPLIVLALVPLSVLPAAAPAVAAPAPVTVTSPGPIAPPNDNSTGIATPLVVRGLTGHITDLDVRLNRVTTVFMGDLDVALTGPNGQTVMLMSDACASTDLTNEDVTIDDEAGSRFARTDGCVPATRSWPVDIDDSLDPQELEPASFPKPTAGALSAFDGAEPNGTWILTVADDDAPDTLTFAGGFSLVFSLTDEVAPRTTITAAPKSGKRRTASIAFTADEPGSTFQCQVDKQPYAVCTSPLTLKRLRPGKHLVLVRATDAAHNVEAAPVAVAWKIKKSKKK